MKNLKLKKTVYRLLAVLMITTTIWAGSIVATYATSDETSSSKEPICGIEAHTHSENCYSLDNTLICTLETDATHSHVATCYIYENKLICELVECDAHTHNNDCYTTSTTASCGKEETDGHIHEQACYKDVLNCKNVENHTHGDGCSETETNLVCGHHVHVEECYAEADTLVCTTVETTGHIHIDTCFEDVLTCENTEDEHSHDTACYTKATTPSCGQDACEAHTHNANCYIKTVICGQTATEGHTHQDTCYTVTSTITCPYTEGHIHIESCYSKEVTPSCGKLAGEAHAHDSECFPKTLTCATTETAGHKHSDSCYEQQEIQICEFHVHSETCYKKESTLCCDRAEHIHGEGCYKHCTCTPEDGIHQEWCELYTNIEKCEYCSVALVENAVHAEDCLTRCSCDSFDGVHQESCELYVVENCEYCGVELGGEAIHAKGCLFLCTCVSVDGIHATDCLIHCTCDPVDNVHQAGCTFYKEMTIYSSFGVTVSGALPETAELAVQFPTDLSKVPLKTTEYLAFAYDISILFNGDDYPLSGTVEVTVPLQTKLPADTTNWTFSVWHITNSGLIETVESTLNDDSTVTFAANSFSVYIGVVTLNEEITDGKIGDYIYMDLAAGNITIDGSTYTGKMYKTADGSTTTVTVMGSHSDANQYYIYQSNSSNQSTTGIVETNFYLPSYSRVTFNDQNWGDYITNNTNPTYVATNWVEATSSTRTSTKNCLTFSGNGTYDVIIDNLWSTKNDNNKRRVTGGISYVASTGGKLFINLVGDNRFGNIHYSYGGGGSTTADSDGFVNGTGIVFQNAESYSAPGTLTVVSYNGKENHYCSVIGGNDDGSSAHEWSCGIVFNSGIIYAGARAEKAYTGGGQVDNCSAIGGGGNGTGIVTINGGKVTAVVSSTGAAIGGGIGESSIGGKGYVTITGGEVYAYNFGYTTFSSEIAYAVPAAAIGGASSRDNIGNIGKVTITGGSVYAESVGGAAIGGGSSTKSGGGAAEVTIEGTAIVTARSVAGYVNAYSEKYRKYVDAGASIGGGTGGPLGSGNGGNATLTVTGGTIKTGSIGGGACNNNNGTIGNAVVNISGGIIQGQVIMAAGAAKACSFTMTGGLFDNSTKTSDFVFLQSNGGAVYMDDPNGTAKISGGTIQNCVAQNGGAVYMTAGTFELSGTGIIQWCTADYCGGAVYLGETNTSVGSFAMTGGYILESQSTYGGAAFLAGGIMSISGGRIEDNFALKNGGGAYLGSGTIDISGGYILSNTAKADGGGIFLSNGTLTVSGGYIEDNQATNGGGACMSGGMLYISDGSISSNIAVYNGGGAYVENGSVIMSGGSVDDNKAINGDGGGMYVSANKLNVEVNIYSGSIRRNTAVSSGGAIAVVGTAGGTEIISVTLGVNEDHSTGAFIHTDGNRTYYHKSCPVIKNNSTTKKGGAVYITGGKQTNLNIYCLTESGNQVSSGNSLSDFMMVEGGTVIISTSDRMDGSTSSAEDHVHGQTTISGSVHVLGGDVTLYGATSNPQFNSAITVDVLDAGGSFNDYRVSDKYYKLRYFENFLNPTSGRVTGQYTAYQVPINGEVTISGVIYSHEGYKILGWYTNPIMDGDGDWFNVGQSYVFDGEEIADLTIYAIWETNGYTIQYNPNVPLGAVYSGTMDSQIFYYNTPGSLTLNQFKYPGYIFTGWLGSNGKMYEDGSEIYNLTTKDGDTIILSAQWIKCEHDSTKSNCSFQYYADETNRTLTQECSCEGQILHAVLSVENATYDGNPHPATDPVLFPDAIEWPVTISYTGKTYAGIDYVSIERPTQAGEYTVTLAAANAPNVQVTTDYIIAKADQAAPTKAPVFDAVDSTNSEGKTVTVLKIKAVPASSVGTVAEYRLAFYNANEWHFTTWVTEDAVEDGYACIIQPDIALVNYYVEARYAENGNYNASPTARGDQVYFYKGDVKITVSCDPGISAELDTDTGDGVSIKATLAEGYYLTGTDFVVTATTTGASDNQQATLTGNSGNYTLSKIPSACSIHLTITGAKRKTVISSFVTEKQVFGAVSGTYASICCDSAFTAYYSVGGYDAEVYSDMKLSFNIDSVETQSHTIPINTTIILLNKADNTFWSYTVTADNGTNSIPLCDFTRMGGSDRFAVFGTNLEYQFIVDFSRTAAGCSGSSLTLALTTVKKEIVNNNAPILAGNVSIIFNEPWSFHIGIANDEDNELIKNFELSYTASLGAASKWDNRKTTLVLTPKCELPADTTLLVTLTSGQRTSWPMSGNGTYIIPLSVIKDETVSVELVSDLLPLDMAKYEFDVQWIICNSTASKAPGNGYTSSGEMQANVIFTKAAETLSAMKVVGTQHLLTPESTLSVKVTYNLPTNAAGCTVTAELLRKDDTGNYNSTAWNQTVTSSDNTLNVSLFGQTPGSFCLILTMKRGVDTIQQVPYYFIIS